MKHILITGSSGLIGRALVNQLALKHNIYTISRNKSENKKVRNIQLDFSSNWNTGDLPKQLDTIIHLSQSEKFRDFPESAEEIFNVNTVATLKLLNYAKKTGVSKFIYASSGGVYGSGNSGFSEEFPVSIRKDLGFYLSTKFCSELLVQSYAPFFNVDVLRFFFVYGPGQRSSMLMPRLVHNIRSGNPIDLQGQTGLKLNPIYVTDAAHAILEAIKVEGNNFFNIAGNEILTLKDIANEIGSQLGIQPRFNCVNSEPNHLVGDNTIMRENLFNPTIGFKTGIRMYIDSLKSE